MATLTLQAKINNGILVTNKHINELNGQEVIVKIYSKDLKKTKTYDFKKFLGLGKGIIPNLPYNDLINNSIVSRS